MQTAWKQYTSVCARVCVLNSPPTYICRSGLISTPKCTYMFAELQTAGSIVVDRPMSSCVMYICDRGEMRYKCTPSMRGKTPPLKKTCVDWVKVRVRGYFINNTIIHSVNNILILLSMINSVNVNNNKLQIANRKIKYYTYFLFFTLTLFIIDRRIRILLTLCIIIF
jgi:hypothetical protein